MRYGISSGILWGLDTVILGIAVAMWPFSQALDVSVASACLHDLCCALILFVYMAVKGRLKDTYRALKTRPGRVVMGAALLGGPLGMTGYLMAIPNIGAGYTAVISAFYPAFGSLLAVFVLHERMKIRQVIALSAAVSGLITMSWLSASPTSEGNSLFGIAGALVCVIGWGSEAVILAWGMRHEEVDNETALQIRETTSALVYALIVVPISGSFKLTLQALPTPAMGVIALAGVAGTVSYLCYYQAIHSVGAARGMAMNISYSAWAVIFAMVLLGVIPKPIEILCCIVILVGTILSATANWSEFKIMPHKDADKQKKIKNNASN